MCASSWYNGTVVILFSFILLIFCSEDEDEEEQEEGEEQDLPIDNVDGASKSPIYDTLPLKEKAAEIGTDKYVPKVFQLMILIYPVALS